MRPTFELLKILGVFLFASVLIWIARLFVPEFEMSAPLRWFGNVLLFGAILLVIAALIDAVSLLRGFNISIDRRVLGGFSQGVKNTYQIAVKNHMPWHSRITLVDGLPSSFSLQQPIEAVQAKPGDIFIHDFVFTPQQRGDFTISPAWVRSTSKWGLWERVKLLGGSSEVQVYPNFSALRNGLELGLEHQMQKIGVHMMQRRGEGIDFRQLREFVYGDSSNKVDWKASARMGKLISREYQDERDQNIYFMLDCGHRMRAIDEGVSYFDHAVNALLMTAFVALKQGDSVGLVSFAGDMRWIAPVKGENGMRSLLNQTYNLQSSLETSDYLQLAHRFVEKRPKRSLVILITSLHADDHLDVMNTIQLLRQKHIVMLVTIDEPFLRDTVSTLIDDDTDAKNYAGVVAYDYAKEQLFVKLKLAGVVALRTGINELSRSITGEYLKLKRAGRI